MGIDRDKLIGQPFIRFVAQDSQDIFHWHCRRVLKTGTRQTCEMQLQKKSGAPHWVHLESLAVDRESGPVEDLRQLLLEFASPSDRAGGTEQETPPSSDGRLRFFSGRPADTRYACQDCSGRSASRKTDGHRPGKAYRTTVHPLCCTRYVKTSSIGIARKSTRQVRGNPARCSSKKNPALPNGSNLESLAVDRESGPVTHWQTALLDITEQKRTEGALRLAKFSHGTSR